MPMGGTMVLEEPSRWRPAGVGAGAVQRAGRGPAEPRRRDRLGRPADLRRRRSEPRLDPREHRGDEAGAGPGRARPWTSTWTRSADLRGAGRWRSRRPAPPRSRCCPSQNASGNFVKVTQLVPVKIQVDTGGPGPAARDLGDGADQGARAGRRRAVGAVGDLPRSPSPVRERGSGAADPLTAAVASPAGRPSGRPGLPLAGAGRRRPRHLRGGPQPDDRQRRPAAHHPDLPGDRRSGPARADDVHAGAGRLHAGHRLPDRSAWAPSAPTSARSALFTLFTALCGLAPPSTC